MSSLGARNSAAVIPIGSGLVDGKNGHTFFSSLIHPSMLPYRGTLNALSHNSGLSQWDVRKCDISRDLKNMCTVELVFS